MEKFIQPRGTGRTYNICKYAIEHDCDIVSPTTASANNCICVLKTFCDRSKGQYVFCKAKSKDTGCEVFIFRYSKEDLLKITVYNIWRWQALIGNKRHVVVDDIDECLKRILCVEIDACSIESYNPADVVLKKESIE